MSALALATDRGSSSRLAQVNMLIASECQGLYLQTYA